MPPTSKQHTSPVPTPSETSAPSPPTPPPTKQHSSPVSMASNQQTGFTAEQMQKGVDTALQISEARRDMLKITEATNYVESSYIGISRTKSATFEGDISFELEEEEELTIDGGVYQVARGNIRCERGLQVTSSSGGPLKVNRTVYAETFEGDIVTKAPITYVSRKRPSLVAPAAQTAPVDQPLRADQPLPADQPTPVVEPVPADLPMPADQPTPAIEPLAVVQLTPAVHKVTFMRRFWKR